MVDFSCHVRLPKAGLIGSCESIRNAVRKSRIPLVPLALGFWAWWLRKTGIGMGVEIGSETVGDGVVFSARGGSHSAASAPSASGED